MAAFVDNESDWNEPNWQEKFKLMKLEKYSPILYSYVVDMKEDHANRPQEDRGVWVKSIDKGHVEDKYETSLLLENVMQWANERMGQLIDDARESALD